MQMHPITDEMLAEVLMSTVKDALFRCSLIVFCMGDDKRCAVSFEVTAHLSGYEVTS